jgi:transposase
VLGAKLKIEAIDLGNLLNEKLLGPLHDFDGSVTHLAHPHAGRRRTGSYDPSVDRHSVGAQPERCDDHHQPPGVAEAELRPGMRLSFCTKAYYYSAVSAERTRIVNRMKAALSRLGIRGFNPKLKKAAERLKDLRTPEDQPIPPNTLAELRRDMERRRLVSDQIRQIEHARLERIEHAPSDGPHAMVLLLARVIGIGIETADMLVQEVLSRNMRDRRAVARYAGLTGSPDESGTRRREKGLARSGNARVRRGMIQLAWRFLMFQKGSALAQWFRARTENARGTRKTMIVALARKLLIALWRLVREGVVPDGIVLRPAQ